MPLGQQQTIDMGVSMETEEGLAIIDLLNEVSDVTAMAGAEVTFVAGEPVRLAPFGQLLGVDYYACPRGAFVLFREPRGANWAVAGASAAQALAEVPDAALRDHLQRQLSQHGLAS